MNLDDKVRRSAEAISAADALLITAGAGIGVDSGLPDFRGTEGFWKAYPAVAKLGLSFADMANPSWFEQSPELAWAFYGHRLNLYRATTPHDGFARLLNLGSNMRHDYFVFTSNVDGQFQKAGFDPERIVECHGSIHHFQCTEPCGDSIWDATQEAVHVNEAAFQAVEPLPKCRLCSGLARPNILMFGDWKWQRNRNRRQLSQFNRWLDALKESSARLVIIELGAGTAIPTVRHTSETITRQTGGTLIRINVREDSAPPGQIGLPLGAAEGVRRICNQLKF